MAIAFAKGKMFLYSSFLYERKVVGKAFLVKRRFVLKEKTEKCLLRLSVFPDPVLRFIRVINSVILIIY